MKKLIPLLAFAAVTLTAAAQDNPNPSVYGDIPDYGEKYLSPDFVKLDKKAGSTAMTVAMSPVGT